jgi:site-specific DNA recombinase
MRVAIYTRVSSEEQALEGYSLDAQLHRLRAYCTSQGWTVADVYTDEGISAKDMERPELQRMLADIRDNKVDVVLVYKLDRLTRSVRDLYEMLHMFEQACVGFKSATEVFDTTTAMGRLFITIVGALAQWERETIGERVYLGQAQMVREGKYFGHTPPYGYALRDGMLFVHPTEAYVVRTLFDLYLAGMGISRIVKYFNTPENHVPRPRNGGAWSMKVVHHMLKNPVYCGYVRYGNKSKTPNQEMVIANSAHEPIISEETFNRAQQLMKQRRRVPPRSGTGIHPLVGVLRCGMCGGPMIGRTAHARLDGRANDYYGYMCNARRQKRTCNMKMWKREVLESHVVEALQRIAADKLESTEVEIPDKDELRVVRAVQQALQNLRVRRKKWMDAFNADNITAQDLGEQLRVITEEQTILESHLKRLSESRSDSPVTFEQMRDFQQTWQIATPIERKELIRYVVDTIWVYPDGNVRIHIRA